MVTLSNCTYSGSIYFVDLIDDNSRKVWLYIMKYKYEVFNIFKQWRDKVENQIDFL